MNKYGRKHITVSTVKRRLKSANYHCSKNHCCSTQTNTSGCNGLENIGTRGWKASKNRWVTSKKYCGRSNPHSKCLDPGNEFLCGVKRKKMLLYCVLSTKQKRSPYLFGVAFRDFEALREKKLIAQQTPEISPIELL